MRTIKKKLRILLIAEQCDPRGMSVPLLGYRFTEQICRFADVTLVTREKYLAAIQEKGIHADIISANPSKIAEKYSQFLSRYTLKKQLNWPLLHALKYPLYVEFNRFVYRQFVGAVKRGEFDLVHAVTPMIPRYPIKLAQACIDTPFIIGPVNGGLSFPQGFSAIKRKEYGHFNFLRSLVHLLPGYKQTYQNASLVLMGSRDTEQMLQESLKLSPSRLQWFPENGIPLSTVRAEARQRVHSPLRILFVGRLVAYKGVHLLIEAIHRLTTPVHLTIVGEGPERERLEHLAEAKHLKEFVHFTGWISQEETQRYYEEADLFCFPSVREFGGAVVMEALAAALPCIVADHGGIGETVTDASGIKLPLSSESQLIDDLTRAIQRLTEDSSLYQRLSKGALEHAHSFTWESKGEQLLSFYERLFCTNNH